MPGQQPAGRRCPAPCQAPESVWHSSGGQRESQTGEGVRPQQLWEPLKATGAGSCLQPDPPNIADTPNLTLPLLSCNWGGGSAHIQVLSCTPTHSPAHPRTSSQASGGPATSPPRSTGPQGPPSHPRPHLMQRSPNSTQGARRRGRPSGDWGPAPRPDTSFRGCLGAPCAPQTRPAPIAPHAPCSAATP